MRYIKKISSIVLAVCMLFSTPLSVFAKDNIENNITQSSVNLEEMTKSGQEAPSYGQLSAVKFIELGNAYLGGVAVDSEGSVWTWGWNGHGQLGLGKTYAINNSSSSTMGYAGGMVRVPYFLDNNINIISVSAGYHHYLALDDMGNVYAWGYNNDMQIGKTGGNYNTPQSVAGLPKIKKIAGNNGYLDRGQSFAIDEQGNLWSWGSNLNGKHGVGTTTNTASYQATPHQAIFPDGTVIVDVQGGDYHNVALDSNGNVYTWGYGVGGLLGNGNTTTRTTPTLLNRPAGMGKTLQISVSYGNNILLDDQEQVWQWGTVYQGPAAGNATTMSTPKLVQADSAEITRLGYTPRPTAVFTGESISYFIDQYGRSWAWGDNRYFGLGREGGYETANDIRLTYQQAQQWPRVIGDGDT